MLEVFPAAICCTGLIFPHLIHAADGVSAYLHPVWMHLHPVWMPPWVYLVIRLNEVLLVFGQLFLRAVIFKSSCRAGTS